MSESLIWIFRTLFSISECLISFTKRKLKIRTSVDTSFLLIDINTSFSSSLIISFCLNKMNDESTLMILKMKLAIDARNFLKQPRSRLINSMNIIESIMMRSVCSKIDSTDDSIDDSIDEKTLDENDNTLLLSTWSFW